MSKPISGFWDNPATVNCINPEESSGGEICVECNKCGRFDHCRWDDDMDDIESIFGENREVER